MTRSDVLSSLKKKKIANYGVWNTIKSWEGSFDKVSNLVLLVGYLFTFLECKNKILILQFF